jgi:hypothetical protein
MILLIMHFWFAKYENSSRYLKILYLKEYAIMLSRVFMLSEYRQHIFSIAQTWSVHHLDTFSRIGIPSQSHSDRIEISHP